MLHNEQIVKHEKGLGWKSRWANGTQEVLSSHGDCATFAADDIVPNSNTIQVALLG